MMSYENNGSPRSSGQENLLIVDDSNAIIKLLSAILVKEGVMEGASNGRKALEMIRGKYYSVIITDVAMPVMNGIEFFRRASDLYPNIKDRILFYTSSDDRDSISFFEKNSLPYLIKPADIYEIRKSVGRILNRQTA